MSEHQTFLNSYEYQAHCYNTQRNTNLPKEGKPVVHYVVSVTDPIAGYRARVVPVDHPAVYLNGQIVTTSLIISVDENGKDFETMNTRYVFKDVVKH